MATSFVVRVFTSMKQRTSPCQAIKSISPGRWPIIPALRDDREATSTQIEERRLFPTLASNKMTGATGSLTLANSQPIQRSNAALQRTQSPICQQSHFDSDSSNFCPEEQVTFGHWPDLLRLKTRLANATSHWPAESSAETLSSYAPTIASSLACVCSCSTCVSASSRISNATRRLVITHDERRTQSQRSLATPQNQQAFFKAQCLDSIAKHRRRLACLFVQHQFDADHQPAPAHVAYQRMAFLPPRQPVKNLCRRHCLRSQCLHAPECPSLPTPKQWQSGCRQTLKHANPAPNP